MRAYSVAVAAAALGVDRKWLDNVLTHHDLDGVHRERQGVSRMIEPHAITTVGIAIELTRSLGSPIGHALRLAERLVESGEFAPAPRVSLRVDVGDIDRQMVARLAEAVEVHPPRRRGRPPTRASDPDHDVRA
jgi:hypothetical protein